jgi:hypothetical protein
MLNNPFFKCYKIGIMWLFQRKRIKKESQSSNPSCPFCESRNTRLIIYHGTGEADYVKVWRGQRSLTYKCLDCGQNFYAQEPKDGISEENLEDGPIIDDEEALRAAEKELKRQTEEDDDRRYR